MSTESDENIETTSLTTERNGPRAFVRTVMLVVGLLATTAAIYYLAVWLRGIILNTDAVDGGEWATLLGGGLGVWAFYLIRTGIIQQAFDLLPKVRTVVTSIPRPAWSTFFGSTWDLSKTLMMPGLVTVFALVFVGEHIAEQVTDPPKSPLATQIDELHAVVDSRLKQIEGNIKDGTVYMAALDTQGYTTERAQQLDRIDIELDRSNYYFARFPIAFEPGDLNDKGSAFVRGAEYDPIKNLDIVAKLVDALIPCASVNDPVKLRVEGYASSEPFFNTTVEVSSEDLNLRLANERRHSVKEALVAAIDAAGLAGAQHRFLVVEADDYRTIDEMEADREFNDRPTSEGPYRRPQDFLTRTAHVKVMSAGTCRISSG